MKEIDLNDEKYPLELKQIFNAPTKLYYKGNIDIASKTCIAIIGARKMTEYGEAVCKQFVKDLSKFDVCIVSGLAKGIDSVAHRAALKYNLTTIAVMGTPLNKIYPRENTDLFNEIAEKGLVISEFNSSTTYNRSHFPKRNRIIAGLSVATLVVEAKEKSGTFTTARLALDESRELFCVPGDIDRVNSSGCLKLVQNSWAHPVKNGFEIIQYMREQSYLFKETKTRSINNNPNLNINEKRVLNVLNNLRSKSLDQLFVETKLSIDILLTSLSFLEIKGFISIKNGKYLKSI